MDKKNFKLSAALHGHSLDVRCVTVTDDNSILSGSRDKTAKYWKPNGTTNNAYNESMTYRDQKNFVGSILYLEPSTAFPDGLVITGGNDNIIFIYQPHEPFASITLKEHTNTVSSLSRGLAPNSFLSGSWDTSAKYWALDVARDKSLVTYAAHTAAIWCVQQLRNNSHIVTASADKTIGLWMADGTKIKQIQGHTDCVRGLADFPDISQFVSVSNDASIKVWSYDGDCLDTYYGHTNYIYSIARRSNAASNDDKSFVTSDEDRTVRVWANGINTETFQLPAQSVWSVACLTNGDIVTGSSDGIVRIFTQNETRIAEPSLLNAFNVEVEALTKQSVQEIGGYKVSDLPGREGLYEPGKKAGQMKMIREAGGVVAYTWVEDGDNSHWDKVGEVLGGTNKDENNVGKTMYEGKSYDFVFSVDVEDGKPALKLPYNKGQNPYEAANDFMAKNMLPADYLEQIVSFILKNSNQTALPLNNEYMDPFTGGSRYTPGSGPVGQNISGANVDPFTGSNSYSTATLTTNSSTTGAKYFPQTVYRSFDIGDAKIIIGKLKEFNKKCGDSGSTINETNFDEFLTICNGEPKDPNCFDLLFKLLDWPDDIVFPVLDVVRMAVRYRKNNDIISTINNGILMEKLKNCLNENSQIPNNIIVALRTLANLFLHEEGEKLVLEHRFDILENITSLRTLNKNGQIALSTFLLNLTVSMIKTGDDLGISILADVLPDILTKLTDPESQFRCYVALGTLLTIGQQQITEVKVKLKGNSSFIGALQLHSLSGQNDVENKRVDCVKQIQRILTL